MRAGTVARALAALAAVTVLDAFLTVLTGGPRVVDLHLLVVLWFALRGGRTEALAVGALAGLAQDSLGSVVFGSNMLGKVVVAYAASLVARRFVAGQALTHAVVAACAVLLDVLVRRATGFVLGQSLVNRTLGEVLLGLAGTVVFGTLVFGFFDRLGSRRAQGTHVLGRA